MNEVAKMYGVTIDLSYRGLACDMWYSKHSGMLKSIQGKYDRSQPLPLQMFVSHIIKALSANRLKIRFYWMDCTAPWLYGKGHWFNYIVWSQPINSCKASIGSYGILPMETKQDQSLC